jgi:hypothetical protein
MKKILLSFLLISTVITAISQQTINDPNAEKRNVSGFHAIEVGGGIDLYLSQGDEAVAVSASETRFRDKIITEVVNGVLKIRYEYEKGNGLRISFSDTKKKLKAYVSYKELDKLHASGGSDVDVQGTLKASKLDLGLSGGSDFNGKVDVNDLNAGASGGSDLHISGSAKTINIDVSGGSDFKGFDLVTENCTVDASGGSDVSITANKELNVDASGGSDVHYKGTAVITKVKSSGGGSVKRSSK